MTIIIKWLSIIACVIFLGMLIDLVWSGGDGQMIFFKVVLALVMFGTIRWFYINMPDD